MPLHYLCMVLYFKEWCSRSLLVSNCFFALYALCTTDSTRLIGILIFLFIFECITRSMCQNYKKPNFLMAWMTNISQGIKLHKMGTKTAWTSHLNHSWTQLLHLLFEMLSYIPGVFNWRPHGPDPAHRGLWHGPQR